MKKIAFIIFSLAINLSIAQSDGERLKEAYMKEFDPQGYAYYKYNDGIKKQGQQIAQSIASQLDQFATLNKTEDPQALINDFNNKMNNIDQLELALEKQTTNLLNEQANQLGNQLKSGDYMGAFANVMGSMEAYSSAKEQQKQLEAKRAQLQRQKEVEMSAIWRKKYAYTKQVISQLRQQAAYAETEREEEYYVQSMDYVWCNYHSTGCNQPSKSGSLAIENKFMSKDAHYRQIADRKINLYESQTSKDFMIGTTPFYIEDGNQFFVEAAAAYAAKAASLSPTASNYIYLAQVQSRTSNILGFASILVAKSIDPSSISGANEILFNNLKAGATLEIDQALRENNTDYLKAFLSAGLDKTIQFDNKSLLSHAISIDNPDAVQLILNYYMDGMGQEQMIQKARNVIMISATQDSPNTLRRFTELGVSTDFKLNGHSPISIAAKTAAPNALAYLLTVSDNSSAIESQYANSPGFLLLKVNQGAKDIASGIASMSVQDRTTLVSKMVSDIKKHPLYIDVLGKSSDAKALIRNDKNLNRMVSNLFIESLKPISSNEGISIPASLITNQLFALEKMPLYGDLLNTERTQVELGDQYNIERIDMLIKRYEKFYQTAAQYMTGENIAENNKTIQSLREYRSRVSSLTDEELKEIDWRYAYWIGLDNGMVVWSISPDKRFGQLLREKYPVVEEISFREKLENLAELQRRATGSVDPNTARDLEDPDAIPSIAKEVTLRLYAHTAIKYDFPLDELTIRLMTGSTSDYSEEQLRDKSLAFVAYAYNDYALFSALDQQFDLSLVKDSKGQSLLESLKKSHKPIFPFYSYDFKDRLTLGALFENYYLKYGKDWHDLPDPEDLKKYLNLNLGSWTDDEGNNILHYAIMLTVNNNGDLPDNIKELIAAGARKDHRNNNGKTPLDLLNENKEYFIKYWEEKGISKKVIKSNWDFITAKFE